MISIVVLILLCSQICHECKKINKEGQEVTVRYLFTGLKAFKVRLDLEGIKKGLYDMDERPDERLMMGIGMGLLCSEFRELYYVLWLPQPWNGDLMGRSCLPELQPKCI